MTFNSTLEKFGYPDLLISENEHWYTLLRPEQITFASMILICKNECRKSFSQLESDEQESMFKAIKKIEKLVFNDLGGKKINYLALMMVDPFVHYHIVPRYNTPVQFEKIEFTDPGFPALPDLGYSTSVSKPIFLKLVEKLKRKIT